MNRARQRGAAMVELAILVPVLLMLAFGITELGRALYQYSSLGKSVDGAARYMSRAWGAVTTDCVTDTGWGAAVIAATNVAVSGDESGAGEALLPALDAADISIDVAPVTVSGLAEPACVIRVTAAVPFQGVFGDDIVPFTQLGPITLSTAREVRFIGE